MGFLGAMASSTAENPASLVSNRLGGTTGSTLSAGVEGTGPKQGSAEPGSAGVGAAAAAGTGAGIAGLPAAGMGVGTRRTSVAAASAQAAVAAATAAGGTAAPGGANVHAFFSGLITRERGAAAGVGTAKAKRVSRMSAQMFVSPISPPCTLLFIALVY